MNDLGIITGYSPCKTLTAHFRTNVRGTHICLCLGQEKSVWLRDYMGYLWASTHGIRHDARSSYGAYGWFFWRELRLAAAVPAHAGGAYCMWSYLGDSRLVFPQG